MDALHVGKKITYSPGGSTANTIYALQTLGLKTGYIGRIGQDENGKIFAENMEKIGIDLSRTRMTKDKTGICHIKIGRNKRTIFLHENFKHVVRLSKKDLEYIKKSRAVYIRLSNILFRPVAEFCQKHNKMLFVSMHDYKLRTDPFDIINGHKAEAIFSGGHRLSIIRKNIRSMLENNITIVLTNGPEGCEVYQKDRKIYYKGLTVSPLDPTGAGDSFAAGFIFGMLKSWAVEKTCDFANFMGAVATTKLGARTRIASLEEYEIFRQSGLKKLVLS